MLEGQQLGGRYQILLSLGGGSFGKTYLAKDIHIPHNPVCVVKHLQPDIGDDPRLIETARRLFYREAEALATLGDHDQIPRLLAYFEEDQEFYLVQEFIKGHPLSEELPPGRCWTESQVSLLLSEVLSILEFIHGQGVIHRDIKPENIIRRQQDNKLVLIDFGAVKQVYASSTENQLATGATITIGTMKYMPAEQVRGRPRPCSDLYALGIVGIQALTGLDPHQLHEDEVTGEILWRDRVRVSDELANLLANMVRYHFKERYQSAAEVRRVLQSLTFSFESADLTVAPEDELDLLELPDTEPGQGQTVLPSLELSFVSQLPSSRLLTAEGSYEQQPTHLESNSLLALQPETAAISPESTDVATPVQPLSTLRSRPRLNFKQAVAGFRLTRSHLLVGSGIAVAVFALGFGSYAYTLWRATASARNTLREANELRVGGQYGECITRARTVPEVYASLHSEAQTLIKRCQAEQLLTQAEAESRQSQFRAAIDLVQQVPQDPDMGDVYQRAQQRIKQWSDRIFQVARNRYDEGKLAEAIALAEAIPASSPIANQVQEAVEQWTLLQNAQQALESGRWQSALNEAEKVKDQPPWRDRRQRIIQQAQAALTPPAPSPPRQSQPAAPRSSPPAPQPAPAAPTPRSAPVAPAPQPQPAAPRRRNWKPQVL